MIYCSPVSHYTREEEVRAKISQSIDFIFNVYCSQIMSYLCQKRSQKRKETNGVIKFVSEVKRIEKYHDFEK